MSASHAPAGERVLLDAEALQRTLHRVAHEIIEANERLESVALIGIHTRGVFVAQRLRRLIEEFAGTAPAIGTVDITFYRDDVQVRGREAPLHPQPLVRSGVERLMAPARSFDNATQRELKKLPTLRGRTVVNLFFESSTRTSSSFELAAKRLSADVMSIKAAGSSVDKGESLKDTALTLGAYDPDVIVIRHPQIGAPQLVARFTGAHVVNAGDGKHQHPTQALLDLYTIQEELGRIDGLHVAIVGDVLHSRVARSNLQALELMGARGALVGPPPLLPRGIEAMGCELSTDIAAIGDADVVYVLRMQQERMEAGENFVPGLREYSARWGVTPERLRAGQKGTQ